MDAIYTEYFADFLKNNELPGMFYIIPDFSDLFVARYCNREIGFETEALFKFKLEMFANLYILEYKEKLDALETILTNINDPTKTRRIIKDFGKMMSKSWVLPFNNNVADPSSKGETDAYQNVDTEITSGWTIDEIDKAVRIVLDLKQNLIEELLNKFDRLFMGVYRPVC